MAREANVRVDLNAFAVYDNDTVRTITTRVAAQLDSAIDYTRIISVNGLNLSDATIAQIKRSDSADIIAQNYLVLTSAGVQEAELRKYANTIPAGVANDIFSLWIQNNVNWGVGDFASFEEDKRVAFVQSLFPAFARRIDISQVVRDKVRTTLEYSQAFLAGNKQRQTIEPLPSTEMVPEKLTHVLFTDIEAESLSEVFDMLVLNSKAPFANLGVFYKIQRNTIVPETWREPSDQYITVKYLHGTQEAIDMRLSIAERHVVCNIHMNFTRELDADFFTAVLRDILPERRFSVVRSEETEIVGVFIIPNQDLNVYVLEHLVLVNSLFSNFFIDESDKATKRKTSIWTYFNTGTSIVSAVITPRTVDFSQPSMRKYRYNDSFAEGSDYVRVRVSATDLQAAGAFQDTFTRMMRVYNQEYPNIVRYYQTFISNFGKKTVKAVSKKPRREFLRQVNPELFSNAYSRQCQHAPRIVAPEDVGKYDSAMVYPKTAEEGPQFGYTCDNQPELKYIGLQELKTNKKYRYVPCCFQDDQEAKPNSQYNRYFQGAEYREKASTQQKIITTNKFVRYNFYGTLNPFATVRMFFPNTESTLFYRWGVDSNNLSFLQCILEATDASSLYDSSNATTRTETLRAVLEQIADSRFLPVAKQSMYESTLAEIRSALLDDTRYQNPRLFLDLYAEYFGVNIILVTDTEVDIPRFARSYLTYKDPNRDTVIIFEHKGSESDHATHPRCEIIVRAQRRKRAEASYVFESSDPVVQNLETVFRERTRAFTQGFFIEPIDRPLFLKDVKAQIFDAYGKTAALVFEGDVLAVLDMQIAPLSIRPVDTYTLLPKKNVRQWLDRRSDMQITDTTRGAFFVVSDTLRLAFPFESSETDAIVPLPDRLSAMDRFNASKRTANYLIEYAYYAFSQYANRKGLDMSDGAISRFSKYIVIDPVARYTVRGKNVDENTGFIDGQNKLVVPDEDTLKRVVFCLRTESRYRPLKLKAYHTRRLLDVRIQDVSDFAVYPNQIILVGAQSINNYVLSPLMTNRVFDTVLPTRTEPYFFLNTLVNPEKIYVATNVDSIDTVLSGSTDVTIFSFVASNDIRLLYTRNDPERKKCIIGFKVGGSARYASLVQL